MNSKTYVSDDIEYIGVDDKDIDLFESQYVLKNGISYNSYLIKDDMYVIMDTVDKRKSFEWMGKLEKALAGRTPDYLVVSHLEPDHAYNIEVLARKYPHMQIVGNEKTFAFMPQFFDIPNLEERKVVAKEGSELHLGKHTLKFFMAPMVHWPEVMVTYEKSEKLLFTADGFGTFGAIDSDTEWIDEARRYYINIVGKYGMQVQALLKKASTLDINKICPLHGPVLKDNLGYYLEKYDIWSSYKPEDKGVLVAYASIHGNTKEAAEAFADILREKGEKNVILTDLARDDMSIAIENAFRYDRLVLASSSYNFEVFPPMEHFLRHLKSRNFQNRKIGLIENGTWAPTAAKCMKEILDTMKDLTYCETTVTIRSKMNTKTVSELEKLADEMMG